MRIIGAFFLILFLPVLLFAALFEPTFLGEMGLWQLLSFLGVASFVGWLLAQFKS